MIDLKAASRPPFSRAGRWLRPLALSAYCWALCIQPTLASKPGLATMAGPKPPEFLNRSGPGDGGPSRDKQLNREGTRLSVPMLPDTIPDAIDPDPVGIVGLVPDLDTGLGIGHLRPETWQEGDAAMGANWLRGVALPIYSGPDGDHWGWMLNGWLIPNGSEPIAIGRDATFSMLEADAGLYSFPVLSLRDDGWFSFQYTPAGVAWAHVSQLEVGPTELIIETWAERLANAPQVQFRKHGVSQALRQAPDLGEPLVSLVGSNSLIEPLEVTGDWMRVRVTQPAEGCTPLAGANSQEGWMRWRDANQELLVWFAPQGC